VFDSARWTENVEPDALNVWYRSGWQPTNPRACQTLDPYWAQVIRMLSTARLEWPICDCTNAKELSDYWRQDAAMMTKTKSFNLAPSELSNPFGQRVGEILAWRRIQNRMRRIGRAIKV
jgi:hypothetical protein